MYQKKFNGESNDQIVVWLRDSHGLDISSRQLWTTFKNTIPQALMDFKKKRPGVITEDDQILEHIKDLEKVAAVQLDRINSQRWDELDQEGIGRMNPQTGEIEYAATNKHLNDTIRTYNGVVKSILEMKAAIGLVKKQPETIEIKAAMNTPTRLALKDMIHKALQTGPDLTKFIQENNEVHDAEYTEHVEPTEETENVNELLEGPVQGNVETK